MEKIKFASFILFSLLLFSCGNKETKPTIGEVQDSTTITTSEPEVTNEVAVEEMTLSLTMAKDPCFGNNPDYLHIKGGKPFDDKTKPYKVEAKNTKQGSVTFGKFSEKDGTYTIDIPSTTSSAEEEVTIKIIVTDANGTEKTIDFIIPFCM